MDELTEQLWKQQREQRFVILNSAPVCPYELHCWSDWEQTSFPVCPHPRRYCRHCGCYEYDAKP